MIQILIVEDEVLIAENISEICIEEGYHVCNIAYNAGQAMIYFNQFKPDLILMDINLNDDLDGLELGLKMYHELKTAIIYITSYSDNATLTKAVESRPLFYLVKPFHPAQLKSVLNMAVQHLRNITYNPRLDQSLIQKFNFSERELEIVRYIIDGKSNIDIARMIYLSLNTVKFHLKNIYQKMNVHNRGEAVAKLLK